MVHPGKEASVLVKQSPKYLQDDDGMLGGVLIQQVLEVGGAGAQDHLVGFGVLALEDLMKGMSRESPRTFQSPQYFNQVRATIYLGGNGHVTEALFIPEMFEGGDHVGLEIVPAETKLLFLSHLWADASSVHSLKQCGLGALKILNLTTQ